MYYLYSNRYPVIVYKQASTSQELQQILELQQENLKSTLSESERKEQGFLTVEHTLELLKEMNEACGHIIALDGEILAGYALCMHPKFSNLVEVLKPMFEEIKKIYGEHENYMVMGQICVAKAYRGRGLFRGLYQSMKVHLPVGLEAIITEVDGENNRSLNAHYSIGFETLEVYTSGRRKWHLIILK